VFQNIAYGTSGTHAYKSGQIQQPRRPVFVTRRRKLPDLRPLDQAPRRVQQQAEHMDRIDTGEPQPLEMQPACAACIAWITCAACEPGVVVVGKDKAAQHEEKSHAVLTADQAARDPAGQRAEQVAVMQQQYRERGDEAQARDLGQGGDGMTGRLWRSGGF
jgi:hypothetical protein